MDMHPLLQVLFQFAFYYPMVMAFFWMSGGLYYYYRRERHSRPRNDPPLMVDPLREPAGALPQRGRESG